jgi:hypothetical protein
MALNTKGVDHNISQNVMALLQHIQRIHGLSQYSILVARRGAISRRLPISATAKTSPG